MKIYKIKNDLSFHTLFVDDQKKYFSIDPRLGELKRVRKIWEEKWNDDSCLLYIHRPVESKKGNFYNLMYNSNNFVYDQDVYNSPLGEIINEAGEELVCTLDDTDEQLYLLNTLACYNCLDKQNSELEYQFHNGEKHVIGVKEYSFHTHRIGDSNIFTLPENYRTNLFCVTDNNSGSDFYTLYHKLGFTGLIFEEIWTTGKL